MEKFNKEYPWNQTRRFKEINTNCTETLRHLLVWGVWIGFWMNIPFRSEEWEPMIPIHIIYLGMLIVFLFWGLGTMREECPQERKSMFYDDMYKYQKNFQRLGKFLFRSTLCTMLILIGYACYLGFVDGLLIAPELVGFFLLLFYSYFLANGSEYNYLRKVEHIAKQIHETGKSYACLYDMANLDYPFASIDETSGIFLLREQQLSELFEESDCAKLKEICNTEVYLLSIESQTELDQAFRKIAEAHINSQKKLLSRLVVLNYKQGEALRQPEGYDYYEAIYYTQVYGLEEINAATVSSLFINDIDESIAAEVAPVKVRKQRHPFAWGIYLFFHLFLLTFGAVTNNYFWCIIYIVPFVVGGIAALRQPLLYRGKEARVIFIKWAMYLSTFVSMVYISLPMQFFENGSAFALIGFLSFIPLYFLRPSAKIIIEIETTKRNLIQALVSSDESKSFAEIKNWTRKGEAPFYYSEDGVYGSKKILKRLFPIRHRRIKNIIYIVEIDDVMALENTVNSILSEKEKNSLDKVAIINTGSLILVEEYFAKYPEIGYGNAESIKNLSENLLSAVLEHRWIENYRSQGIKSTERISIVGVEKNPFQYINSIEESTGISVDEVYQWEKLKLFFSNALSFENLPRSVMALYDYIEMSIRLVSYYELQRKKTEHVEVEESIVSQNYMGMAKHIFMAQRETNPKLEKFTIKVDYLCHGILEGIENELNLYFEGDTIDFFGLINVTTLVRNKIIAHGVLSEDNAKSVWAFTVYVAAVIAYYLNMNQFQVVYKGDGVYIGYEGSLVHAGEYVKTIDEEIYILASVNRGSNKKATYVNYFNGDLIVPSYKDL